MRKMRAKMVVSNIEQFHNDANEVTGERLHFQAVGKNGVYPDDGSDEDNDYARWTPSADVSVYVANPNLFGQFKQGERYYVDFTLEGGPIATPPEEG